MPASPSSLASSALTLDPNSSSGVLSGLTIEISTAGVHVVGAVGGLQRQLVERHRPKPLRGRHERDLARVALLDVPHEPAQRRPDRAIVDRDHPLKRRVQLRSSGDHERVVVDLLAVARDDPTRGAVDAGQRTAHMARAEVEGYRRQRDVPDLRDAKRLGDRHRAVVKVSIRGQQRDLHQVAGHGARAIIASSAPTPPPAIRT
jgi:hypothetical protein